MAFTEVTKDEPCLICSKSDWCRRDIETGIIECHRIEEGSVKTTEGGFYIHVLNDDITYKTNDKPVQNSVKSRQKANISQLHTVILFYWKY